MRFLEQDEEALRAVMSARAAEVNGQGDAEAKITTQIEAAGDDSSRVRMETDLQMRGRVAQFGRGAMEKISQRMFDEFARNLEREMAGAGGVEGRPAEGAASGEEQQRRPAAEAAPSAPTGGGTAGREAQALDAVGMFVTPVVQKALPVVGAALVGLGYGYLLGRLRELRR
jgi:hypothetical protein